MGDHKQLESQIREIIAAEQSASCRSAKSSLARRACLANWRDLEEDLKDDSSVGIIPYCANRFLPTQQSEAAAFARAVAEAEDAFPSSGHRVKLEHVEST